MGRRSKNSRRVFIVLSCSLVGLVTFLALFPDVSRLKRENPKKTSFMEYREKEWRREGKRYRVQQTWVPLARVSPFLIKAVIIAEDDKFWRHEGFDYDAILKAAERDLKKKTFALGGSTITQQLAKNLYLSPAKNPIRKFREAVIAWRMEKVLAKRRILELYLNVVEWGDQGIFGAESAARHYFGKSASELDPRESALLAAVLPNPRRYHPLGGSRYVQQRADRIYAIMVRRGIVLPEYEEIIEEKEELVPRSEQPVTGTKDMETLQIPPGNVSTGTP